MPGSESAVKAQLHVALSTGCHMKGDIFRFMIKIRVRHRHHFVCRNEYCINIRITNCFDFGVSLLFLDHRLAVSQILSSMYCLGRDAVVLLLLYSEALVSSGC